MTPLFDFLLNRWTVLVFSVLLMFIGLKSDWTVATVKMIGKMSWAENKLGEGGTYTVWKLLGIIAPIIALIYFFNGGYQVSNNQTDQNIQNQSTDYSY